MEYLSAIDPVTLEAAVLEAMERQALIDLIWEQRKQMDEMRATIERQAARIVELERQARSLNDPTERIQVP